VALSQDRHQRRKVGGGARSDLHLGSHEVQRSDPLEPIYLFVFRTEVGLRWATARLIRAIRSASEEESATAPSARAMHRRTRLPSS
jgi:hypothetical protein